MLLVFVPVAIVLELLGGNPTLLFISSALGIVPLAGLLGESTDALAEKAGDRIGALLNATLGNAAELIITIAAIQAGLAGRGQGIHHRFDSGKSACWCWARVCWRAGLKNGTRDMTALPSRS